MKNDEINKKKIELLNWSMKQHDLNTFEAKIEYKLEKKIKKNRYFLDIFFFIPRSLQINTNSYSKDQFFTDMTNYIRFKTPQMPISSILNEKNDFSPLNSISININKIENVNDTDNAVESINYELRLLACMIRTNLRDQFMVFTNKYKGNAINSIEMDDYFFSFIKYLQNIEELQNKIKKIGEKFITISQITSELRDTFNFVDDYISLKIEENLTHYLKFFHENASEKIKNKLKDLIIYEKTHRKSINSLLIINKKSENENFSYWKGILKKYVQSILYLEKKPKNSKSTFLIVLYSIAAGIAMFFSLLIGFLITEQFQENSISLIIALIVVYIFKDRIKEIIREISNNAAKILFPDRHIDIYDGFKEEKIGICKESMNFEEWKNIPEEIINLRESSNKSKIERKGKPENVFHYKRIMILFAKKIKTIHSRHRDLSDIIRFNIQNFLHYADDSIKNELFWNASNKTVEMIPTSNIYHIQVIFRISYFNSNKQDQVIYKKFQVLFNQEGIIRVVGS